MLTMIGKVFSPSKKVSGRAPTVTYTISEFPSFKISKRTL